MRVHNEGEVHNEGDTGCWLSARGDLEFVIYVIRLECYVVEGLPWGYLRVGKLVLGKRRRKRGMRN